MTRVARDGDKPAAATDSRPKILLGSGSYFIYEEPEAADLTIEDIAYGLAFAGRFAGQCVSQATGKRVFYSVAEHCVRMSWAVPEELALYALMHEAGESTCGDMPGPLKKLVPQFREIEKRCEAAALAKFRVGVPTPEQETQIKHFDRVMRATERRDLMPSEVAPWPDLEGVDPLPEVIEPWAPEPAAEEFLARFHELSAES